MNLATRSEAEVLGATDWLSLPNRIAPDEFPVAKCGTPRDLACLMMSSGTIQYTREPLPV